MKSKGFTLVELLIVLSILVSLAVVVTVGWVAVHFVVKFW